MPFLGTTGGASVKQYGGQANLGYFIKNSVRLRSGNSAYFSRTPATITNRDTWTWSGWVKRGTLSSLQFLFQQGADNNNASAFQFNSGDTLEYNHADGGTYTDQCVTSAVFRDPAAWYHLVLSVDTTQATDTNRIKIYVNGTLQSLGTANYPAQNVDTDVNTTTSFRFGSQVAGTPYYYDGYLGEINFIDGQQLTPSSFGKTDAATGQWIPKKFAGTYGTNGFYLKFADASAATAAAIGKDSSGNGNNWTPSGISVTAGATYDAMIDSPTLSAAASNYAVLNPLALPPSGYSAGTFLSGNLQFTTGGVKIAKSTMAIPLTGKWYIECRSSGTSPSIDWIFGLTGMAAAAPVNHSNPGVNLYISDTVYWLLNASTQFTQAGAISSSDVFQIAYDSSTGKVWLGKNNTYYTAAGAGTGNPSSGTNEFGTISTTTEYCAYTGGNSGTTTSSINFGQQPFTYTPPSGFKSLNTYNLP